MATDAVPLADRFPALRRLGLGPQRRIPVIEQLSETECGAACLAMVLGYHGRATGLEEVRDACAVGRDGVDALRLIDGAAALGLRGRGLKVDLEQLSLLPPGSTILHWEFNHFVVLARVDGDSISVIDPAAGRRTVPLDEVRRAFTGVALTFEPGDDFVPRARRGVIYPAVRDLIVKSGLLPRLVMVSLVLQGLGLALPVLTAQVVDRVLPRGDVDLLGLLLVGLGWMIAFETLGTVVRGHLLSNLRTRLDCSMSLGFLDHLVSLPYSYFQLRSAGDLMMRLNSNSVVREHLTATALAALVDGLMVVGYLAVLLIGNRPMAAAALVAGALEMIVYFASRPAQRELVACSLQAESRSQGYEVEMLTGMETLKASGCEQRAVAQWSNLFVDQLNVSLRRDRLSINTGAILGTIRAAAPLAVLGAGALEVMEGRLSVGTMLALAAVAGSFIEPLSELVRTAMSLELIRGTLQRVADVLQAQPEREPGARVLAPLGGQVALDRVSFRYAPDGPLVVDEVSVEIRPGQFVAIVGRSGAGKSTLANLILGLHRPTGGRILFDGADLATLELRSLRQQLGIINQNVSLFAGTVRDNISLADPSLGLAQVRAAARRACIDDEIMAMPLGYSTPLGERGSSLSGGQRQRLALARALVRRPSILLLDEATSALDAATERQVAASLDQLACTRVVIAHRLSTVCKADLILVMEAGRLIEAGDHRTLLHNRGPYAALVAGQMVAEGAGP